VCGPTCRAARDRKLARARRRRELEDYRDDERERQRQSRGARRAKARAAETDGVGHAPPSAPIERQLPAEVIKFVERAVDRSRASLKRDLLRFWPLQREIVVSAGEVSRASFGRQGMDSSKGSGPSLDDGHA
jgi:hypothetical protein